MSATDDLSSIAADVVAAIRDGDLAVLRELIDQHPQLATARVHGRTALHAVADWPGYYPNGPAAVRLLVASGADPNARTEGGAPETPLHWAASSDDLDVNATVEYGHGTALDAASSSGTRRDLLATWLRENGARPGQVDN
jgi:uncharacterized protein